MKKVCFSLTMTLAVLLVASSVLATTEICRGKVNHIDVNDDGWLYAEIEGTGVFFHDVKLCNIETAAGGISAENCKAMQSLLVGALLSGREVVIWMNGTSINPGVNYCNNYFSQYADINASAWNFYRLRIQTKD